MPDIFDPSGLHPGDLLIYRPTGLFGLVTAIKTWNTVAGHVEVYVGNGMSVASRNGSGVDHYPLRLDKLCRVLRPMGQIDVDAAQLWFYSHAKGQGYDVKGLLCFYLAAKHGSRRKMFCSEFATRWYRRAGFNPFALEYDADYVAPVTFLVPPRSVFDLIWTDRK